MRIILAAIASALALLPGLAAAHPLGNFSVNRFSRLEPGPGRIGVHFVVDMAEIPAFQELSRLGAVDGRLAPETAERYARARADALREQLKLTVDGQPAPLAVTALRVTLAPGQGGLRTLRLEVDLEAPARPGAVVYQDDSYGDRLGWKEIVLRPAAGVTLDDTGLPSESVSDELRAYPESMLQLPLNQRTARFAYRAIPVPAPSPERPGSSDVVEGRPFALAPGLGGDAIGALAQVELTWPLMLAALLAAASFGALHALSPGHGKTVVAAYLVGARGTSRHALALALIVTATHTWGVFALGLLTLYAGRLVEPERLYPWLSLGSGLMIVAMGVGLLRSRLGHARGHGHSHDGIHWHVHAGDLAPRDHGQSRAGLARAGRGRAHADHHHHHHHHDDAHDHAIVHRHGPFAHSHAPPERLGWRGLIALGVVGGLLPCPSALILMLASVALGRVALGIGLVLAFSLGLAAVLMAIGLLFVYARSLLDRLAVPRGDGSGRPALRLAVRLVPVGSALAVVVAGAAISAAALPAVLGG